MRIPHALLAVFVLTSAMTIPSFSQEEEAAPSNPRVEQQSAPDETEELINVDFKGGSAADYVQAVRKAARNANIVVMNDISKVPMPETQLRNVTVWSAVQVLSSVPKEHRGQMIEMRVDRQTHRPMTGGRQIGPQSPGEPVYVISARHGSDQLAAPTARDLSVMELSQIVGEATKADDVLSIVESALGMFKQEYDPADVRFHESTGVLIVRGHPEQVRAVEKVMIGLRERHARAIAESEPARKLEWAYSRIEELEMRLAQSEQLMRAEARDKIEWQTRGEVLGHELERTKAQLTDQIEMLQRELQKRSMESSSKPQ